MSDWQVGDLALCVAVFPCEDCGFSGSGIAVGQTYEVAGLQANFGKLWLYVPEAPHVPHEHWCDEPWFEAEQFRKIRPDEHQACEPEFVTLLKRSKRKVSA